MPGNERERLLSYPENSMAEREASDNLQFVWPYFLIISSLIHLFSGISMLLENLCQRVMRNLYLLLERNCSDSTLVENVTFTRENSISQSHWDLGSCCGDQGALGFEVGCVLHWYDFRTAPYINYA